MTYKLSSDDFAGLFGSMPDGYNNPIYTDVLYAQALLESTNNANPNGMSTLYTQYNNAFGMKPSSKREKLWTDKVKFGSETFATYADASGTQSLLDRVDLDKWNGVLPPASVGEVLGYMAQVYAKGYATDPDYIKKWRNVLFGVNPILYAQIKEAAEDVNNTINPFSIGFWFKGLGLVATAIIGFILYKKFIKKK